MKQIAIGSSPTDDTSGRRGLGKAAVKRKRRRGPGGLGRGLARILIDSGGGSTGTPLRSGLVELVGGQSAHRLAALEGTVADVAIRSLMGAFDLRALAVAATAGPDDRLGGGLNRSVMPEGWSTDRGPGAQLDRWLRSLLDQPASASSSGPTCREIPVGGYRLWLYRAVEDDRVLAAAAARQMSLPPSSAAGLGAATRALASSLGSRGVDLNLRHAMHGATRVSLKSEGHDVLAEVNAEWPIPGEQRLGGRGRRAGVGRAGEPVLAVARAAAKACRPRCEVLFAGVARDVAASTGDAPPDPARPDSPGAGQAASAAIGEVAVVLVRHQRHGLRIGWAERPRGDLRSVTEAVFTAAL